jgi:putative oxidoreductase
MNLTNDRHRLTHWADSNHSVWIDYIRVGLGLFLMMKGIWFVQDTEAIHNILRNSTFPWVSIGLAHYVAFAHLVGGLLIAIGLITRVAILFQIPILLGAVFFINSERGFYTENSELWISLIVLVLLIFFLIVGSGKLSVDRMIRKPKKDWLY